MSAQPRPLMVMSGTPESRQPFSAMHRALYASIVGDEAVTTYAHGCTVKQYEGTDYVVDHVTRLARPMSSFPAVPVVSEADFTAQHKYLYELKDQLDVLRPQVKKLEESVKEHHKQENRLEMQARRSTNHATGTKPVNVSQRVLRTVPTSETHLVSLIAQVLRIGDHSGAKNLNAQQVKLLKVRAPALANYFFKWKQGSIVWGQATLPPKRK